MIYNQGWAVKLNNKWNLGVESSSFPLFFWIQIGCGKSDHPSHEGQLHKTKREPRRWNSIGNGSLGTVPRQV